MEQQESKANLAPDRDTVIAASKRFLVAFDRLFHTDWNDTNVKLDEGIGVASNETFFSAFETNHNNWPIRKELAESYIRLKQILGEKPAVEIENVQIQKWTQSETKQRNGRPSPFEDHLIRSSH